MPNRYFGIEQGYLASGGIQRTIPMGGRIGWMYGLDAEAWWVRQITGGFRPDPRSYFRRWGHMLGLSGSTGFKLPAAGRLSVSLALQGGFAWNPSWPGEWVPTGGVSTALHFR